MKTKLQTILPLSVPSPLFVLTCVLLLVVGALCWAATQKIAREADEGMRVLTTPATRPASLVQARG